LSSTATGTTTQSEQLLLVEVRGALYGLDTTAVREIVAVRSPTRLPGSPPWVLGLINLRGTLVTVADLVRRLSEDSVRSEDASMILVESLGRQLGVAVDDVRDVVHLDVEPLEATPSEVGATSQRFVRGLGHFAGEVVIVLDVHELVRQTLV